MSNYEECGFATRVIHEGQGHDPVWGALSTPIFQTSTFCFETVEEGMEKFAKSKPGFVYSRSGNPTTMQLEQKLAAIEGAEAAVATASGMGAISSVMLSLLKSGDHVVVGTPAYGSTSAMFYELPKFGIEVSCVDLSDANAIDAAVRSNTMIVYLESIGNPTMAVADIEKAASSAHRAGALLAIDNTFTPPPICFPLKLGADISIHSTTKYMNGHGDVIGGVALASAKIIADIRQYGLTKLCGTPASPFNSWLVLRGMKTLNLRVRKHCENAIGLAKYLESNPKVSVVHYPGLSSHPQHGLCKQQFRENLFGAMISFELKDGINGKSRFEASKKLLNNLHIFSIAVSLGDPDSLIEHPASMTHLAVTPEEREKSGITEGLIRISPGLEDVEDLIADLEQSINSI